jgi:MarR family transcriptional regulator, lower aerobic nicotinate degradation pathway regulator
MSSLPVIDQGPNRSAALLVHLARHMRLRSEAAIAPLGLRARHLIALTVLRDHGGSTQQALSTTLQIDRTNLVGLLNDLEAEALIARRRSSEDRRRHIVELTHAGAQLLAQAEAALAAAEDEVLSALDHDQRETLYRLLQQATTEAAPCCLAGEDQQSVSAECAGGEVVVEACE